MSQTYRHQHYAGNHGDLLKHVVLHAVLSHLKSSMTTNRIMYFETHAGEGYYDLRMQVSGHANSGIGRLRNSSVSHPILRGYRDTLTSFEKQFSSDCYPGSPELAHRLLSDSDQIHLCDWSPEAYKHLRHTQTSPNAMVYLANGYEKIQTFFQPLSRLQIQSNATNTSVSETLSDGYTEHLPVVLVDPPYSERKETESVTTLFEQLNQRNEQGVFMLWYPTVHDIENAFQPLFQNWKGELLQYQLNVSKHKGSHMTILSKHRAFPKSLHTEINAAVKELQILLEEAADSLN